MSQLILDDQLDVTEVGSINKWITAQRLQELRPGELIYCAGPSFEPGQVEWEK